MSAVVTKSALLEHFERISEAPDAVTRLRRFVLDLAVQGRLVEQDPSDEPAALLLERIAEQKCSPGAAPERLRQRTGDRAGHPLPRGWAATSLGGVTACLDFMRQPVNATERARRIAGRSEADLYPYFGATQQQGWIDGYLFDEELLLLGEDGAPFLDPLRPKAYLVAGKTWVNNHAHVFRGILVSPPFLSHCLNTADYTGRIMGATRGKLNQSKALEIPIALPPLAEQYRIEAKVDELTALCDELEVAQAKREKRRDRLVTASLHALSNGEGTSEPASSQVRLESTRFYLKHCPRLTTRPEHIQQLRQTILDLAVRGRLVQQAPDDEPAAALIARILSGPRARRAGAASESGSVEGDPSWFSIPECWDWARLEALIVFGPQNGVSPRPSTRPDAPRAVTLTATTQGYFDAAKFKYVEADFPAGSEYWLSPGDLLFQRGNTRDYVGIAAIYDGEPNQFLFPDLMIKVRVSPELDLRYFHLATIAPYARRYFSSVATGAQASMPKINHAALLALPIPVPPLAEQHRIVAKFDELMTLCDALEAGFTVMQDQGRRLLVASLFVALGHCPP